MTAEIKKEIRDKIEAFRKEKKLNKSDIARALGYSVAYYIRLVNKLYKIRSVASLTRTLINVKNIK